MLHLNLDFYSDNCFVFLQIKFHCLLIGMASCGICSKTVKNSNVQITCKECSKVFHGSCLKMSKADVDYITADELVWRCPPCASNRRKSLRFETEADKGKLTLEDIMKKINEIAENQRCQEVNFNKSYEHLSEQLQENTIATKEQNSSIESCLKIIDNLARENKLLAKKVNDLEQRIDEMEQYSRANSVEIQGIPVQPNEDIVSVVKEVGKAMDMNVQDSMIDACHRMGRKNGNGGAPPGIIVKFVRRLDKEEFLKKRRVKRNLSTRHMNMNLDQPVYVNEALTSQRRRLLAAARQVKKDRGFKFLWVRGGIILLRKDENSPVVKVTCQADLVNL